MKRNRKTKVERKLDREEKFLEWRKKLMRIPVGGELNYTSDRIMECAVQAWAYRRKDEKNNDAADVRFLRKESRGNKVFLVRYK
jgi:hypothetical protein